MSTVYAVEFEPDELLAVMRAVDREYEALNSLDWDRRPDLEREANALERALDKLDEAGR